MANRQDLNSSVMTGSSRIVDHTTFTELEWRRDPFSLSYFQLSPGFQARSYLLNRDLIEVLEDIHALQCIRECARSASREILSMAYINNHQASIQSRLVGLVNLSPIIDCCRLAAYLCSSMLCCTVWCASVIPVSQLNSFRSCSITSLAPFEIVLLKMYLRRCQINLGVLSMAVY